MSKNVYVMDWKTKIFKFPAGEISVNAEISKHWWAGEVPLIIAHIQNSDDIMSLLMLNDSLKRQGVEKVDLLMPYIPYSRQDRICNEGEALSIKVFCDLINSCKFSRVIVLDPHSDVAPALLNNVEIRSQVDIFSKLDKDWDKITIIAPDGGALKKAEAFGKAVGAKRVVAAMKKRDLQTGHIEYVKLTESVTDEDVFVLDDICEGGGTFLLLAEQLKNVRSKELAVTHGIFSKGIKILTDVYDHVYTTNSYHPEPESNEKLTVLMI